MSIPANPLREWRKYTNDERLVFAETAREHGIRNAAERCNVSPTAIRTACAVHAVVPKRINERGMTKNERLRRARATLRVLGVTVRELVEQAEAERAAKGGGK